MNVPGNEHYMNKVSLYLRDSAKYKVFPPDSIIYPKNGGAVFTNKKRILTVNSLIDLNTGAYIPSNLVDNKYAYYLFSTIDFNKFYKGTSVPTVDHDSICELFFGLPPLVEQKEIVKQLSKVFKNIDIVEEDKSILLETVSKTKSKILDLAIHGKLVPQDPNDEPASVLLEKLRAEKEEKIAKGELKRDKNDSYIYKGSDNCYYEKFINGAELEAEIPYDIPENWTWCKIKNLTNNMQYGTSEKSRDTGKVPVLRMGNITREGKIDYSDLVYTSNEKDIKELKLKYNDILFNRTNSIEWVGKTAIFKENFPCICAGYIISFTPNYINPDFLNYVMNSSYQRDWCNEVKTDGVNQSNINSQKLADFYVPFPPIREQLRIVKSIENLFSKLDNICLNLI